MKCWIKQEWNCVNTKTGPNVPKLHSLQVMCQEICWAGFFRQFIPSRPFIHGQSYFHNTDVSVFQNSADYSRGFGFEIQVTICTIGWVNMYNNFRFSTFSLLDKIIYLQIPGNKLIFAYPCKIRERNWLMCEYFNTSLWQNC